MNTVIAFGYPTKNTRTGRKVLVARRNDPRTSSPAPPPGLRKNRRLVYVTKYVLYVYVCGRDVFVLFENSLSTDRRGVHGKNGNLLSYRSAVADHVVVPVGHLKRAETSPGTRLSGVDVCTRVIALSREGAYCFLFSDRATEHRKRRLLKRNVRRKGRRRK